MKKPCFQEHPDWIEFAAKNVKSEQTQEHLTEYKKEDPNKLVWGRPFFGIYDRYGGNENNCYLYSGPGNDPGIA